MSVDLAGLKEADQAQKPSNADQEWLLASRYYEDSGRQDTQQRLKQLGVGLKDNTRPLEISLLRRIVDRISILYDQIPTRWLNNDLGQRLAEDSAGHQDMIRVLDRAQYDLAWRRIDKLRALFRQVVPRYYPSDSKKSVVVRIFEPYNVIREPNPSSPDELEQDRRFGLKLASSGDAETWEYWENQGDGIWTMRIVDESGKDQPDQPFSESGLVNPYAKLPAHMVFDEFSGGNAWLSPRGSRTSFVETLNAVANDLWALIVHQAHTDRYIKTDDPGSIPTTKGPGQINSVPLDTDIEDMSPNPKIRESQDVLDGFVKLWSISEDLSVDEFLTRQVVTGAALKASERALNQRREAQKLLAPNDERAAYEKLRAVHNAHAASWGQPALDESTSLEVVIADLQTPVDMRELQESLARSLAIGTKSIIDAIMAENNVPRHTAIKIYERVKEDQETYPASNNPGSIQEGPKLAGVDAGPSPIPDIASDNGAASVMDLIPRGEN